MITCFITLGFIGFDIITGLMKALYSHNLNSTILRQGLYHKLAEVVSLVGCYLLELGCNYINLGFDIPLLNVVAIYIIIMELMSCIENVCIVNPQLNELFAPYMEKLKDKKGGQNGEQ